MPKLSDLPAVIQREHDAFALETRIAQIPPYVAVYDLDEVTRHPTSLRLNHPANISALPQSKGLAFIVDCPTLNSAALWVGTHNDNYRDDYLQFLNTRFELGLATIPKPYQVDHLYNQERAKLYGLKFLRLALVAERPNKSHGGAYEKDLTTNEALRQPGRPKLMDEISNMKYFGYLSPLRNDPRESEIAAYAAFAASKLGLDPVAVRESILYLRKKASTPWAKKP